MSKQQVDDPIIYRVGIVRQDLGFDPLFVLETMDEAEARSERHKLVKEWEESATNKRPFHLDKLDRSFAPSLIVEIRTEKMAYSEFQRLNSPYERQMREQGTSSFMQQNFTAR